MITIYKGGKYKVDKRVFYTYNDFFSEEVVIDIQGDRIIFTHPTIDYNGKAHRPRRVHGDGSAWTFSAVTHLVDAGTYEIDPDYSDEDQLVIFYL